MEQLRLPRFCPDRLGQYLIQKASRTKPRRPVGKAEGAEENEAVEDGTARTGDGGIRGDEAQNLKKQKINCDLNEIS